MCEKHIENNNTNSKYIKIFNPDICGFISLSNTMIESDNKKYYHFLLVCLLTKVVFYKKLSELLKK